MSNQVLGARTLRVIGACGTGGLLLVAPLAIGGTRPDTQLALAGFALILLMLTGYERLNRGFSIPWPLWGPIVIAGLTALQLVPLPPALFETLSPHAFAIRGSTLTRWHPLSLDPAATTIGLFHQLAFVSVALIAVNTSRRNHQLLLRSIAIGGAIVAIVGLIHWALQADRIFGLYEAADRSRLTGYFSTFVNNNTLAGYFSLSGLVAMGLMASADSALGERIALTSLVLCVLGVVMSSSRGGQFALLIGVILFAALAQAQGRSLDEGRRRRTRLVALSVLLMTLVGVVAALLMLPEWHGMVPEQDGKIAAWAAAVEYTRDYWITGSGRNTFQFIYPHYQDILVSGTVSHPETIGLQLATELGIPAAVLAIGFAVAGWLFVARGSDTEASPTQWGLVAALAAVGLHQLLDFGFESSGLALPTAAVFGLAIARAPGMESRSRKRSGSSRTAIAVVATALSAGIALAWSSPTVLHTQADDAVQAILHADDLDQTVQTETAAHPADYLVALAAADAYAQQTPRRTKDTLGWINRALTLFPKGPDAHLLAARYLVRIHPAQAAIEYRLAMQAAPWREPKLLREAVNVLKSPAHLARATPCHERAWRQVGNLLLEQHRAADTRAVMELLALTEPDAAAVHLHLGRACFNLRDVQCSTNAAEWLIKNKRPASGYALRAQLAARSGDVSGARRALLNAADTGQADPSYLRLAARIYARIGDISAARKAVDRLWRQVAADDQQAAQALAIRADLDVQVGDNQAAFSTYRQAFERYPRARYALAAAKSARKIGRIDEARRFLEIVRKRWPDRHQTDQTTQGLTPSLHTD